MKKMLFALFVSCLVVGLASISLAVKKNEREPIEEIQQLAVVQVGDCDGTADTFPSYSFPGSDMLTATWYADDGIQTKFGGDAKFKVFGVVYGEGLESEELEAQVVDIGLEYDPDSTESDVFLYSCSNGTWGDCTASLQDVQAAIMKEVVGLNLSEDYNFDGAGATFLGVYVKAMNPSVKYMELKRQNFTLEVCGLFDPDQAIEETSTD